MDPSLAWAVIGLVLVIVELLTGTFYLLMLGLAAFGAAGAAWLGYDLPVQVIVALLGEVLSVQLDATERRMVRVDAGVEHRDRDAVAGER